MEEQTDKQTCGNCRYWEHIPERWSNERLKPNTRWGRCHLTPLTLDVNVVEWQWCGQWEAIARSPQGSL